MPPVKLDGAGTLKLKTLEDGLMALSGIHAVVERMANDVKNQRAIGMAPQQVKRLAVPLQGQLKGQFGMIADLVSSMLLVVGRGGSDATKVRALREHVAQLRTAMELAQRRVKEKHAVTDEALEASTADGGDTAPEADSHETR